MTLGNGEISGGRETSGGGPSSRHRVSCPLPSEQWGRHRGGCSPQNLLRRQTLDLGLWACLGLRSSAVHLGLTWDRLHISPREV